MKNKRRPDSSYRIKLFLAAAIADLLVHPMAASAQSLSGTSLTVSGSTTLEGNVSITGTGSVLDFSGNSLYLGTLIVSGSDQPGVSAFYAPGSPYSTFSLIATGTSQWYWGYRATSGSTVPMMALDPTSGLTIYNASGNSIVLNPDPAGTIGSNSLLTRQAAESLFVGNTTISVGDGGIALTGGTASGGNAFAGINSTASGYGSTAAGINSTASGYSSIAIGMYSTASGNYSTASGYSSAASGLGSTAIGFGSTAIGDHSTAIGYGPKASGDGSIAVGLVSTASGYGSFASGYDSTASGDFSTSMGFVTTSQGYGQFVIGQWNITQGNPNNWVSTDDLFEIGNGVDGDHPSNALVVKKNGDLIVNGNTKISGGGLVVTGTAVTSGTTTKIVSSGTGQLVLIPEQGDLSMGDFTAGTRPQ